VYEPQSREQMPTLEDGVEVAVGVEIAQPEPLGVVDEVNRRREHEMPLPVDAGEGQQARGGARGLAARVGKRAGDEAHHEAAIAVARHIDAIRAGANPVGEDGGAGDA
jgi:hypothetical protein